MSYFLILYLTALGLGEWLGRLAKLGSAGLRFFSGWAALAILTTVFPLGFGIPLAWAARLVFAAGLASAAAFAYREREGWRRGLSHPLFLWPLVYVLLHETLLHRGYSPHEGDEFSHWVTMPRQILLFGQITTKDFFYTRFLEYTPGWPVLLDFPLLVQGSSFTPQSFLYAPFLASLAALGILYEILGAGLLGWAGILFVARMKGGVTTYPFDVLVEPPLEAALSAFAFCAWIPSPLVAGLALAYGYLIKKAAVALVPGALLLAWFVPRGKRLRALALTLGPILAVAALWGHATRDYPHLFVLKSGPDTGNLHEYLELAWAIVVKTWSLALRYWPGLVFVAAAGVLGWRRARERRFVVLVAVVVLLYFVGLHWLYITTFPGREGFELRSLERYAFTAFRWMFAAAAVILLPRILSLATATPNRRFWFARAAVPILALACVEQSWSSLVITRKRGSTEVAEAPALIRELEDSGLRGSQVLLLAHGVNVSADFEARYASMDRQEGMAFQLYPFHWFIRKGTNEPYDLFSKPETLSDAEFSALLERTQVVWPIVLSDWERGIMEGVTPLCPGKLEDYFLIRTGPGSRSWRCHAKVPIKCPSCATS